MAISKACGTINSDTGWTTEWAMVFRSVKPVEPANVVQPEQTQCRYKARYIRSRLENGVSVRKLSRFIMAQPDTHSRA